MTVLKRWDGSRIWYPNSMINVVPILNITRSENKWEFFKVRQHCMSAIWVLLCSGWHHKWACCELKLKSG